MSAYTEGRQPCADFKPHRDGNGYAEWDNVHCCYGPYPKDPDDQFGSDQCNGTVSFCENCNSDHHAKGWDTCPQQQAEAA